MSDLAHLPGDRTELIAAISAGWKAYSRLLDGLPDAQWDGPTDDTGWTIKDHVAHVTAWENVMIEIFRSGTPPWQTLQIGEDEFAAHGYTTANALIHARTQGQSVRRARRNRELTHVRLMAMLDALEESEFQRPFSDLAPGAGSATVLESLTAFLIRHYDAHRRGIEAILARAATPGD